MSEETTNTEVTTQANNKKKVIAIIAAAAVIIIALAVGIGIYNTPENRLNRQLDLGNKYLEEQNYEQAAIEFEKAIEIDDRCMEAYTGGIEAYLGAGNTDGAKDFYDRTLTMLDGLDADFLAENMDYAVEIYIAADRVYGGDRNKIVQVLEEGYTKTGENPQIKDKLVENYNPIAESYTQAGSYEDALKVYDRLLELDNTNTETINGLCDCLNKYLTVLMEEGKYDEIRALAEKYGDVAANVDFAGIIAQIEEIERIEAENKAFMQKVYDLMAAQDYEEGMCELDGSEEMVAFVERMEGDSYIYIPDNNGSLSGVGAGIYKYEDEDEEDGIGYYYYYGDYVDGERKGSGTEFVEFTTVGGYSVFTGAWGNDAPNGEGTEIIVGALEANGSGVSYNEVISGILIDGLWDGQVRAIMTDGRDGREYDVSFSAVRGVPTEDKTEEVISYGIWELELEEGKYIYAYDFSPSSYYIWYSFISEGEYVGIPGFVKVQ